MRSIELPVPPPLNQKFISRSFVVSKHYRTYKDIVQMECAARRWKPYEGEVEVEIVWYRKVKQGDVDGRIKPVLDAMEGYAYHNDAQVKKLTISRTDQEPKKPRILVTIKQIHDKEVKK